jgi:hypothetical protein
MIVVMAEVADYQKSGGERNNFKTLGNTGNTMKSIIPVLNKIK